MIRAATLIILVTFAFGAGAGQSTDSSPEFEVASIKPSPPPDAKDSIGPHRIPKPRTPDPSLFVCDSCTLSDLVRSAYNIRPYQLSCPSWMESERFTVNARIPPGTTREQLRLMQQNLLQTRFKLACHREKKEMPRFELMTAKGGPKLRASVGPPEDGDATPRRTGSSKVDEDGFPVLPRRRQPEATFLPNGHVTAHYVDWSMTELATILSNQLHQPVMDVTGLDGKFDFTLSWVMDERFAPAGAEPTPAPNVDPGPTIFMALRTQLGLRLEKKKGPVERLVIDGCEKVPTDN